MRKRDLIKEAAEAHTDLNVFASLVSVLEGGHIYESQCHRTAERIIDLCKAEQSRCLQRYDAALALIETPMPRSTPTTVADSAVTKSESAEGTKPIPTIHVVRRVSEDISVKIRVDVKLDGTTLVYYDKWDAPVALLPGDTSDLEIRIKTEVEEESQS